MREAKASLILFGLDLFVHSTCVVLTDGLGNLQDLHSHRSGAHSDLNLVADLHFVTGLDHTTVNADAPIVAGLVGNGSPLDETGNLQILVKTHLTLLQRPSGSCWP